MKFTAHKDECEDYDGTLIKGFEKDFECFFEPRTLCSGNKSRCFVIYKGFLGKWKIREEEIRAVMFTNCWFLATKYTNIFLDDIGKTVFKYDELDKAIRICEEKNRLGKVKVKYLDW